MVFAMSKHNMNAGIPSIFRSYQVADNRLSGCTIWEVLCASMAHPELFKSIEIGKPPTSEWFVDGSLGCNNPIAHVLAEAKSLFPDRHVSSVTSIGTGHARTIRIPNLSLLHRVLPVNVSRVMKGLATDSERVAQEMAVRFRGTANVYFRFNVDQGMWNVRLSDWERLSEVTVHTRLYMLREETKEMMDRSVRAIKERLPSISMVHIGTSTLENLCRLLSHKHFSAVHADGEIQTPTLQQTTGVKMSPSPTPVFTGQEAKIEKVENCIACGDKQRCVFVLHGLGGAGKTQIALRVIEKTHNMWTDIVYIDATSRETTASTLEGFATAKMIGKTYEDTIWWLANRRERWLMVFDNADDSSLDISDFFPAGNHGSILITTRMADLALLARGPESDCNVTSMEPGEALELLLKTARMQEELLGEAEREAAIHLLEVCVCTVSLPYIGVPFNVCCRTLGTWHSRSSMQAHTSVARSVPYFSIERCSSSSVRPH
jgi:predicted acylesterase/phospholipase RssA